MLEITTRLDASLPPGGVRARAHLELPFELRQKSRLRARLDSGEEVAIVLPRGVVLRGGDLLAASDGSVVEVIAQPERLLHVECDTARALARAAYHLGNRHVAVQVGDNFLRLAADHVLEQMLVGLGARLTWMQAPFEPEAGAYAEGHTHGGGHSHRGKTGQGGRIHEFGGGAYDGDAHRDQHHHTE